MPALNKVILAGYMTSDPELKQTSNGISTCRFSIGVTRRFKDQNGNSVSDFINIVTWRQQAEFVSKYFKKGSAIIVCGSIQTGSWTDNNGQKRYSFDVVADEVSFGDSKSNSNSNGRQNQNYQSNNNQSNNNSYAPESYTPPAYSSAPMDSSFEEMSGDDDLPF